MSGHVAQKRNSPRKSALAKAALRKSAADCRAKDHQPASNAEIAEALANRQQVDFLDPFMRHAAMQAKGISLCAFLVTLAAFQRGLKVTFHYERRSVDPRFARARVQGHRGELFSISDGTRTHTFSRTLGDLADPAAIAIAEDKHLTKAALRRAGVRTPEGIAVEKGQTALIEKFLAQHSGKRFVVKPPDGSLGQDVHANLTSDQVPIAIDRIQSSRLVVEEYICGNEYRVFVAGDRYVASYLRAHPHVIGDGTRSITQLIQAKNAERSENPYLSKYLIEELDAVAAYLKQTGLTLESTPSLGSYIELLPTTSVSRGGDAQDTTHSAPKAAVEVATSACAAIGLSVSGVDVIVAEEDGRSVGYVIELNQRPHIGSHGFPMHGPGQGNAVSEAIIDYFFPNTIRHRTHPGLAYDFGPIRAALESAQITELSLPVIGPDWRVLRFAETGIAAKAVAKLIETAARTVGVFVMSAPAANGGVELCLAYAPSQWLALLNVIPSQLRARLEQRAVEAGMCVRPVEFPGATLGSD